MVEVTESLSQLSEELRNKIGYFKMSSMATTRHAADFTAEGEAASV
jgi:hypothetical protein